LYNTLVLNEKKITLTLMYHNKSKVDEKNQWHTTVLKKCYIILYKINLLLYTVNFHYKQANI